MSENSALVRGVEEIWDAGFVVVVAAGNMGPGYGTITTPGISRKVITVGCSDDDKEVNVMGNRMSDYSGRGPTRSCICKPDIVAPGAAITSCSNQPGGYAVKSGTSMATPLRIRCHCPAFGTAPGDVEPGCKAFSAGTRRRSRPPQKSARLGTSRYPQPSKMN